MIVLQDYKRAVFVFLHLYSILHFVLLVFNRFFSGAEYENIFIPRRLNVPTFKLKLWQLKTHNRAHYGQY